MNNAVLLTIITSDLPYTMYVNDKYVLKYAIYSQVPIIRTFRKKSLKFQIYTYRTIQKFPNILYESFVENLQPTFIF